jgi:hypothetical protein
MESNDVTHWGTSIQLTQCNVNAVQKLWALNNLNRVVSPQDHIDADWNVSNLTTMFQALYLTWCLYKLRWEKARVERKGKFENSEIRGLRSDAQGRWLGFSFSQQHFALCLFTPLAVFKCWNVYTIWMMKVINYYLNILRICLALWCFPPFPETWSRMLMVPLIMSFTGGDHCGATILLLLSLLYDMYVKCNKMICNCKTGSLTPFQIDSQQCHSLWQFAVTYQLNIGM